MTPDERYMRQAMALARRALGRTSPNPVVGAVIVADGRIVGRGWHKRAGGPHAEVHALRDAGDAARGATLYVNLEPCSIYGRTPPCVDALVAAGIRRVVAAMADPNPKINGQGFAQLRSHGIEVVVGVLEDEARRQNEAFVKHITTGMPFVLVKAAVTLDGKIASRTGDSKWITSEEARLYVHRLRCQYDAVMVGCGTTLADDPQLTAHMISGRARRDPVRIVVDELARIPISLRLFRSSEAPFLVAVTRAAPKERVAAMRAAGAEVLVCKSKGGLVDLNDLMQKLGQRGILSVMIEGGGELIAGALDAGIVDKLLFVVAPKVVGGRDAKTAVEGKGIAAIAGALPVEITRTFHLGPDVAIEAYVHRDH